MNPRRMLVVLFVLAAAVLLVAPFVGPINILWQDSGNVEYSDNVESVVFWQLRVPRVLVAFIAGAGLATSGMAFQAVFRNPLAEPFTLGVASGASLGVALYVKLGVVIPSLALGLSGASAFAFVGAVLAILLVFGLTRIRQGFSNATLLLAGVAINFLFSSLILFLQYISDFTQSYVILRWIMGGLNTVVDLQEFSILLPLVGTGIALLLYQTHELNLLTTGEDLAASRGMEVAWVKTLLFFAVSLMVGAVVALCGPIGFVGLMAPHICRLLVGPDHRYLTTATLLFGGAFLVLCDTIARTIMHVLTDAPTELPVGILTSLLGGPFFLWLLLGRSSRVEAA